jgi:hypothetical protein
MSIAFVHLSDIHFGQEKGGTIVIHDDAKERLVEDVARVVRTLRNGFASGVIVSGDIAYAGKQHQYTDAGAWLDRVAKAAGCAITDIQLVPGNHDIDRDEISHATAWMLQEIARNGEARLDEFLDSEKDRQLLYARFASYEPFAHGYNSPLDMGGGVAGDRRVELAAGRHLRFIGLNTALICSSNDAEGRLLLGARQRVLPRAPGEELVVIAHHPLHWLQDSVDARRYLTSRARVFLSGHEHNPAVRLERVRHGCDLLLLAAGAAVPPAANDVYTYTYNLLEFEWSAPDDALVVIVHPRAWSEELKDFEPDHERLGGTSPTFLLGCPNFRDAGPAMAVPASGDSQFASGSTGTPVPIVQEEGVIEDRKEPSVPAKYSLLRLRFFRDLTSAQRISVLVKLNALPPDWRQTLAHSVEQQILDSLQRKHRLEELESAIEEVEAQARHEKEEPNE